MAETKSILLKVDVQGNQQLEKLQANFDQSRRRLQQLTKQERAGTITSKQANAERARTNLQLIANRNALNDQRAALLKNNNALRKNSGFVAGVRKGVGQWATSMIGVTVAIAAVTKLVGSAVKIFKDFQEANSKLAAITRASTTEMKSMSDQAKELGATTAFTATQITGLQTNFARLGFPTTDILDMTEATLAGAAALGSDLGEQAALTGALLKQYSLDASEAGRVNDVLAESAASSALDFSKLSTALPIVGATANAVGVDLERTTALLGTLSDRGLDASTSGTSLRNVFLELSKQGLTFDEAMAKIDNSTDKAKTSMDLFGKRGATAGLILAETGDTVGVLEDKLRGADGAAADMAETMLDNLAGDITIANSAYEGFILSLEDGEGVISQTIRGFTQASTELLNLATNINNAESGMEAILNFGRDWAVLSGNLTEEQANWNTNIAQSETRILGLTTLLEKGKITQEEYVKAVELLGKGWKSAGEEAEESGEKQAEALSQATGEDGGGAEARIAKSKQTQEKIAKDKIDIQKKTQDQLDAIEIAAIEDERVRKEVELLNAFERKIEAITGDSEIEKELKLRLAEELRDALNEQQEVFAQEDADAEAEQLQIKKELDLEIGTVETQEELEAKKKSLEDTRAAVIADQTLTNKEKLDLLKKLDAEIRANETALAEFKKDTAAGVAQQAANLAGALSSLAKEGSEEAKGFAIVQAGINGALAITQALAQLGPIAGAIAAVGIGITTGVQIAKISGAEFEDGGVLQGASHANGGIPFTIGGQAGFEAEGGEAIINKRSTAMFGDLLSDINQAGGGVAFARGGLARKFQSGGALASSTGVTAGQQRGSIETGMERFAEDIIAGINDKEVINVSTNTSTVANEVNNIAQSANF